MSRPTRDGTAELSRETKFCSKRRVNSNKQRGFHELVKCANRENNQDRSRDKFKKHECSPAISDRTLGIKSSGTQDLNRFKEGWICMYGHHVQQG